ncbi:ATP-dependent helicase HrpA [Gleimia coleocanis DSM 15436]|uniref:ATP-dependent helicase HrpA n=1 Tax=Gleimia coleocanis DSM 15436 TaxID=525245 RepID=C0VY42_9ACTO|nr:ATP-dependent RNA helicase HrpA [Gleimia coleocanis]EEH64345.1 ATP-dependent helicase HrpA [Gleimia coleocanis DSM 15436]
MAEKQQTRTFNKKRRHYTNRPREFKFSKEVLAARATSLPVIDFPENLPVSARKDEIANAIKNHQVVIVSGETGSGKTTQLPKICLQLGRGIAKLIGHTQPRRLAARAVATRIAEELNSTVGGEGIVGYQVRFTDQVSSATLVKLMTDGILLAEIQNDPLLNRYDTLIIDEAHERSLNIDFLLGFIKQLLPKRPDLKVIITSATIDSARFAQHFADAHGNPAPVITVSGRTYPVEVRYRPLSPAEPPAADTAETDEESFKNLVLEDPDADLALNGYGYGQDIDYLSAICAATDELCAEPLGNAENPDRDILIFLPGERDIRDTTNALRDHLGTRFLKAGEASGKSPLDAIEVVPLYSRLSAAEQQLIFAPHPRRRIVLATNVAETSLTVPGIKYVIDPGLARISRYSNRTKVQRLPIEPISQASANQRSGRCGRVSDGVAIRLYSQKDFQNRPRFTEPEILRTSLASVILQMAALGLGLVEKFPFLDAPAPKSIKDGVALLAEIGAITVSKQELRLTKIGRDLAKLPIDPRLGRMLLEADKLGCSSEVLVIVAALSMQDVRERPEAYQQDADAAHARFLDPTSDFITYLNLWRYLRVCDRELSNSALRRLCKKEFLHYLRFREWEDVVSQLVDLAKPLRLSLEPLSLPAKSDLARARQMSGAQDGTVQAVLDFTEGTSSRNADSIHQALLVGLLSNLGAWNQQKSDYEGARGSRFTVWPGSGLARKHYDWVMAAELVETSRLFARTVARIKPEWVERIAPDLVKRVYSEPFWAASRGAALVREKTMLYGLTLTADREVLLGGLPADIKLDRCASAGFTIGARAGASADGLQGMTPAELARDMFIRHALVENQWRADYAFIRDNQRLLDSIRADEHRFRTGGVISDDAIFAFFDERVPASVVSATHFDGWWRRQRNKRVLLLSREALLPGEFSSSAADFPAVWRQGEFELPLHYEFNPGSERDGVSVRIPLALLPRVQDQGFAWLVPGMLEELLTGVIRALPKQLRQQLVPAPDVASKCAAWLRTQVWHANGLPDAGSDSVSEGDASDLSAPPADVNAVDPLSLEASLSRLAAWGAKTGAVKSTQGTSLVNAGAAASKNPGASAASTLGTSLAKPAENQENSVVKPAEPVIPGVSGSIDVPEFFASFTQAAKVLKGVDVPNELWDEIELPPHLRFTFVVVDEKGKELLASKELAWLQKELAQRSQTAVRSAMRSALTSALEATEGTSSPKGRGKDRPRKKNLPGVTAPNVGTAANAPTPKNAAQTQLFKETTGLTDWPALGTADDALPKDIEATTAQGLMVRAFPALHTDTAESYANNKGTSLHFSAGTKIYATLHEADAAHQAGLVQLVLAKTALTQTRITTRWSGKESLLLAASPYANTTALVAAAQTAAVNALLNDYAMHPALIRSRSSFNELCAWVKPRLEDKVYELLKYLINALAASADLETTVRAHGTQSMLQVNAAVKAHAQSLLNDGFFTQIPPLWIPHVARFIKADELRVKKAAQSAQALAKDANLQRDLAELEHTLLQRQAGTGLNDAARLTQLREAQWLLEELRVSYFAQELGTSQKVSAKRLWNLLG